MTVFSVMIGTPLLTGKITSRVKRSCNISNILNPITRILFYCTIITVSIVPSARPFPVTKDASSHLLHTSITSSPRLSQTLQRRRSHQSVVDNLIISPLSYTHIELQDLPDELQDLPDYPGSSLFQAFKSSPLSLGAFSSSQNNPIKSPTASTPLPSENKYNTNTETNNSSEPPKKNRWFRWMNIGSGNSTQARGSSEIRMRDPVALGGVPRSERYAASDWLHNTMNIHNSAILYAVRGPVASMTIWAAFIALTRKWLLTSGHLRLANQMCLTPGPHGMMVSMLGLLLVFRTNSAYQRFAEGRKIWEDILNTTRELSRLCKLFEKQMGSAKHRRVKRLLAAFPYFLRSRIRPSSVMKRIDDPNFVRDPEYSLLLYPDHATSDSDAEAAATAEDEEIIGESRRKPRQLYWVDKRTLPWRLLPTLTKEECARAQNRPLWVCDRMSKELFSIPDAEDFSPRERLALLSKVDKLSQAIGACERIHQTVVPLNYARHALRSLTVWLFSLPFALVKDMGLMTAPILLVMSWMMFGVYEIGYSIEDPFQGTLRLSILCDAIRRDVLGDEIIRNTAFVLEDEGDRKSVV